MLFGRKRAYVLVALALPVGAALPLFVSSCGTDTTAPTPDAGTKLRPGDVCDTPQPSQVRIRFSTNQVFVAPCAGADATCSTRDVSLIVEPDLCQKTAFTLTASSPDLPLPTAGAFDLYTAESRLTIRGSASPGTYTLTAHIPKGDGEEATADLSVVVLDKTAPSCQPGPGVSTSALLEAQSLPGTGDLTGAAISLPAHANAPNTGSYLWSVAPFPATIACGSLELPAGTTALGPAIKFGPEALRFQREVPLSIPANPALLPDKAHLRHVKVLYSGPAFKAPRTIPVSDLRFEQVNGQWALSFMAPRLGTYQAIVDDAAGTKTFKRRITHRAVIGVSMGGIGSSMFGMRHHDKFDVVAPLGGPGSWTWLLHHIEHNHLGGFRPIAKGTTLADIQLVKTTCTTSADCKPDETCIGLTDTDPGRCTLMPTPVDPYEHPQTFDNWWAEYPRTGTGGAFPRQDYAQIFRDLGLMFGNPNGDNFTKGAEFLPAGVRPDDKSVTGDHPNDECKVWVDPISGSPTEAQQQELAQKCPLERCQHTLTLMNYYDDEFNPDGTFPVITVCDGTPTDEKQSPWANAWKDAGPNQYPLEVALAVDYNGNGKRDELEPIIKSGYEPFKDVGVDGKADQDEPGYQKDVNDDPSGDDYDAQYNPLGTERDFRHEDAEPFDDVGLDGVAGTKQQPAAPLGWQQPGDGYDVGEGNGKYDASRGLRRFWDHDPGNILRRVSNDVPGGDLTDEALARVDLWTDGGLRDLFNFHVAAQHMMGAFSGRGRLAGYYSDFARMPSFDPSKPDQFNPAHMPWDDVPGGVLMRYGKIDPDEQAIETGNGQHVGTASQIALRLETALFFIGSRWKEPELRTFVKQSNDEPAPNAPACEVDGTCVFNFTSKSGRVGPVSINLPPGYAQKDQQDRRYPVIYVLHGYGQTPEDLGAAIVFVGNWMNNSNDSIPGRLPKALLVYVDGRCRIGADGKAECLRGSFFTDSPREGGLEDESWWLELMDYVDANYRTMGTTEVDWTE